MAKHITHSNSTTVKRSTRSSRRVKSDVPRSTTKRTEETSVHIKKNGGVSNPKSAKKNVTVKTTHADKHFGSIDVHEDVKVTVERTSEVSKPKIETPIISAVADDAIAVELREQADAAGDKADAADRLARKRKAEVSALSQEADMLFKHSEKAGDAAMWAKDEALRRQRDEEEARKKEAELRDAEEEARLKLEKLAAERERVRAQAEKQGRLKAEADADANQNELERLRSEMEAKENEAERNRLLQEQKLAAAKAAIENSKKAENIAAMKMEEEKIAISQKLSLTEEWEIKRKNASSISDNIDFLTDRIEEEKRIYEETMKKLNGEMDEARENLKKIQQEVMIVETRKVEITTKVTRYQTEREEAIRFAKKARIEADEKSKEAGYLLVAMEVPNEEKGEKEEKDSKKKKFLFF